MTIYNRLHKKYIQLTLMFHEALFDYFLIFFATVMVNKNKYILVANKNNNK